MDTNQTHLLKQSLLTKVVVVDNRKNLENQPETADLEHLVRRQATRMLITALIQTALLAIDHKIDLGIAKFNNSTSYPNDGYDVLVI